MSVADVLNSFARGSHGQPGALQNPGLDPSLPSTQQSNQQPGVANTTVDPSQVNKTIPGNSTVLSDGKGPGAFPEVKADESPLAPYATLWATDTKAEPAPSLVPTFNINPQDILAKSAGLDFTKMIDPQDMMNATKGDIASLTKVINQVGQGAFANAVAATGTIVREAMTKQEAMFNSTIMPGILRNHQISQDVSASNPAFADPATSPVVKAVEQQMSRKYPTASPAEITKHAQEYLTGVATSIVRGTGRTVADKVDPALANTGINAFAVNETDWDAWIK